MASYQNYQQVIDALKAEYVNARNLKKTANTKKRATRAAASAKTRKDAECGSLESKLTSVKSSILSNLQTAFTSLNDSEYSGLKNELTNSKAKLAFINSEIDRLDAAHSYDPENLSVSAPHPEASATELQTLNSLKNTLAAAIYDSEAVINQIYTGVDYNAIKDAFLPNQNNNTFDEVYTRFQDYSGKYYSLHDATKGEFTHFITSLAQSYEASHQLRDDLVQQSRSLFTQKSQLADLLDSQASQSQIASKETQIDATKAQMLASAAELKIIETSIQSQFSSLKMEKLKRMSGDLYELGNKLRDYRQNNLSLLSLNSTDTDLFISHKSFDFYQSFFYALDETVSKNFTGWGGSQVGEFKYVYDKGRRAKEYYKDFSSSQMAAWEYTSTLMSPNRIMNINQDNGNNNNGNNGRFNGVNGFKNSANPQIKDFYVNYFNQLHVNTRDYIEAKVDFDVHFQRVGQLLNYFNQELFPDHLSFANAAKLAKTEEFNLRIIQDRYAMGEYSGTPEQANALQNAMTTGATIAGDLEFYKGVKQANNHKLNLHVNLFPDFYPQFDSLTSAKISASASYDSAYFTWDANMRAEATIAYDYLQELTAGEASYVAALADYQSKVAANETQTSLYNGYITEQNAAEAFLATTLAGEAEYQAAGDMSGLAQEEVDRLTGLHYIFLGATADADSKRATSLSFYNDIYAPSIYAMNDSYTFLQDLTDEDAAYQSALSNWNSLDTAAASYKNDVVDPAYSALQDATSALDSHLSDYFGEELGISTQGWALKAVRDAKEQADADYSSIYDVDQSNSQEQSNLRQQMTWHESDPMHKREALYFEFERNKKHNSFERIYTLMQEHNVYIPDILGVANGSATQVRQRISQGFDGLLLDVKNYLESNNLFASKVREEKDYGFEADRAQRILTRVIYPTIRTDWNLGEAIGYAANTWDNTFDRIQSDSGISSLRQTIQNKFDQSFRQDDGFSFADRIINEVVNGYPIVN